MTLSGTIALSEETSDQPSGPIVTVTRRGYAWSLWLGEWTDEHRQWLAQRRCSPKRLVSDDVAAFLWAFNGEFDLGQVEIKPFDERRDVTVFLPYHQALDWFAGLASEAMPVG